MDLLDNLLDSMDKTHQQLSQVSAQEKERREQQRKQQQKEREEKQQWRTKVEAKVQAFLANEKAARLCFPPLDKSFRLVIHEVADSHELCSHSFGEQDSDQRFTVLFKKEFAPSLTKLSIISSRVEPGMTIQELDAMLQQVQNEPEVVESPQTISEQLKQQKRQRKAQQANQQVDNYRKQGTYAKAFEGAGELIVLTPKKRDRRTIEEIQLEMKQKKRKGSIENKGEEKEHEAGNEDEREEREEGEEEREESDEENDYYKEEEEEEEEEKEEEEEREEEHEEETAGEEDS